MPFDNPFTPPGPFQTLEAVRAYVAGDCIQCLVCGKFYRRLLHKHLGLHNMTHDDYKRTFGIPWSISLTSAPSREASGRLMTPDRIALFMRTKTTRTGHRRPQAPAVRNAWKQNAELGRYLARQLVTTSCATCGAPVETTALTAVQPIHCEKCATSRQMRARRHNRKKQQLSKQQHKPAA